MEFDNRYILNGEWRLFYADHDELGGRYPVDIAELEASGMESVAAEVPGNFELDLQRAGIIPDPFYDTNTLDLQRFESFHMFYCRRFDYRPGGGLPTLRFEGVDTAAEAYLNGEPVLACSNMFVPHEAPAVGLREGGNEIVIHIKPAAVEARRFPVPAGCYAHRYNFETLYLRKAASMFGWDIMPRIVSGGIWRDTFIYDKLPDRIEELFAYTMQADFEKRTARLVFAFNAAVSRGSLDGYSVRVRGTCSDSSFAAESRLWFVAGRLEAQVHGCRFWYPRNAGEPALYDTVFELLYRGEPVDSRRFAVGVRTVALERTGTTDEQGSGEFALRVNGKKIFAMGTNWVPLDAFPSRAAGRLADVLPMLGDLGCNIVRCWGGGFYEHEDFFDYCDANGVMVWQDFAMACELAPQDETFAAAMAEEAAAVVKKYRNHPSLVLWAGDNECDQSFGSAAGMGRDPNGNTITRRVIPDVLKAHDFTRPYIPSSPYTDEEAFLTGGFLPEEHLWGPRDYFKGDYYGSSVCHFASETGYHGCPSPASLKKFLAPEHLWPWFDAEKGRANDGWLAHAASPELRADAPYAYRIRLMSDQVKTLFGCEPRTLEAFAAASQISQAEAKKYFIERFRLSKWRRTGIIWWNLVDGWPQISDAVVDYYLSRKLAYFYIKRSQQPVCLMFDEPAGGTLTLYAVNDTPRGEQLAFSVTGIFSGTVYVRGAAAEAPADASVPIWSKPCGGGEREFYLIEWQGNTSGKNHYMTGLRGMDADAYLKALAACGFELPG
ncbi:MAG TPA: glycoside hydrolase family 2 TIM barrel-domain containing protein [Clostridiales bacterium]|nr:glycoside hydrolase family 2 TIM barrel-domain containing protein [Clostridiales bacterium]HQH63477.1 glycoside hydrolase family 2 TIM barrel-domain containing protein [Clostridiales bacterium]HQK73000.1 glycoside hydrolase family 2 TIM barrel-domain containing protein [Clostridiales bacterium]